MQDISKQPFKSSSDKAAEELKAKILSAPDPSPDSFEGRVWYISEKGCDQNDAAAPETAIKSFAELKKRHSEIKSGDAVLFERGGIYRGIFETVSGVYYGAYGEGIKPRLYSSLMNYANAEWICKGENIWLCCEKMPEDIGLICFDNKYMGYKKAELSLLREEGDFCSLGDELYLYMDENPAERYSEIEMGPKLTVVGIYEKQHDVTVENLCVRFSGAHGLGTVNGVKNITVRYCEFGIIGGSYLRDTLRFGNAIEFYDGCENITVQYNWIYQVYDSGFTHQGGDNYVAKDINVSFNLIETCGMGSVEYWMAYSGDVYNYAENVLYEGNIMRFAGYCWGGVQRPDKVSSHILSNGANQNHFINYRIIGNIFDRSSVQLLELTSLDETYPEISGNTYIQGQGMRLGTYADNDTVFDTAVQDVLIDLWKEDEPTVIFE